MVLSDTHRFDYTGYREQSGEQLAPNIQRMKDAGVEFTRAYSPAPISAPSYATLLTGLEPVSHGLTNNQQSLASSVLLLPETFREAGYRTAAVFSNPYTSGKYGFDRGFDFFWDDIDGSGKEGGRVTSTALEWLDQNRDGTPFFLFLGYMDAHAPFAAESLFPSLLVQLNGEPVQVLATGNVHVSERIPIDLKPGDNLIEFRHVADGRLDRPPDKKSPLSIFRMRIQDRRIRHEFESGCENTDAYVRRLDNRAILRTVNPTGRLIKTSLQFRIKRHYSPEEQKRFYGSGVRAFDNELGRVLGYLESAGLYDDAVIVFISDHGEMLGEHRSWGHVLNIHEQTMRVPLVIKAPEFQPGSRNDLPFALSSFYATLVDLVGIPIESREIGESRFETDSGETTEASTKWTSSTHSENGRTGTSGGQFSAPKSIEFATYPPEGRKLRVGVLRWPLKLTLEAESKQVMLVDLSVDQDEEIDLYPKRKEDAIVKAMLTDAWALVGDAMNAGELDLEALSQESRDQLRVLGYIQ